jgi:hypothetical protein
VTCISGIGGVTVAVVTAARAANREGREIGPIANAERVPRESSVPNEGVENHVPNRFRPEVFQVAEQRGTRVVGPQTALRSVREELRCDEPVVANRGFADGKRVRQPRGFLVPEILVVGCTRLRNRRRVCFVRRRVKQLRCKGNGQS